MEKKETRRTEHDSFVGLMVEKSQKKDSIPKPESQLSPTKKDDPQKPYLLMADEKVIKAVEKYTKEMAEKVK